MTLLTRFLRHAFTGHFSVMRAYPKAARKAIEGAVKRCEGQHPGEIRFVVEGALSLAAVLRGVSPRQRAVQLFSDLRVWDTEHNDGVLIHVLLADRAVEIVADRGVARGRVPQSEWEAVCREMEQHFSAGHHEAASVAGVEAVARVLARYPAGPADVGDELPDAPTFLA